MPVESQSQIEPTRAMWLLVARRAAYGLRYFFHFLRVYPGYAAGYIIILTVTLVSMAAPAIAPFSPISADATVYLQPPTWSHLLGTDSTGMDVFSRIIFAPRIDLAIAVLGTLVSSVIGTAVGAWVGYFQSAAGFKSFLSNAVMRAADVLQAFPVFVFAIALVAVFGQSLNSLVLAIAFVNIPIYLRLMRSQVLRIRDLRYVEAAYIFGVPDWVIIGRHIVPNSIAPVLAQLSVNIGWSILLTAGLSFVGAGVRAPTPEWGSMIAMGFPNVMTGQWWPSVYPGLALAITVFGFGLIGASIEFLADPRRRRTLAAGTGLVPNRA
jgi:peptide/nickel transport system permease protein